MDHSPSLEPKRPPFMLRYFMFEWDVHQIESLLQWYREPVLSNVIDIQCHKKSSWRFGLQSAGTHLEFFLMRCSSLADELDRIYVRYNVCLVDKFRETFYEERSNDLTFTMSTTKDIGQFHADQSLLNSKVRINKAFLNDIDNVYEGVLYIQCELSLSVNVDETARRNCNPDMMALSDDINNFRDDEDFCDLVWHSTRTSYKLNTALLQARVPNFHMIAGNYDAFSSRGHTNAAFKGKVARCLFLKKSTTDPKAPTPRCFNETVLADVLHFASCRTIRNPFAEDPANVPIPRSFQECFTPPVCEALLSYLYSGQAYISDLHNVRRLYQLARGLLLHDLAHKLEDWPPGCHTCTEMVKVSSTHCLDTLKFEDWAHRNFAPHEKVLLLTDRALTHATQMMVSVHFFKSGKESGAISLECWLMQAYLVPAFLTVHITIMDETGEPLDVYSRTYTWKAGTIWRPYVSLRRKDLAIARLELLFVAVYPHNCEVDYDGFVKFKNRTRGVRVQSFRQLSGDLSQLLGDQSFCDTVLVAQGKTMEAHRFVLCARSRRFRDELRSKFNKEHKITHLVPGIRFETLVEMVKYMYSGDPDLENSDSVERLRAAAENFGVTQLKDTCRRYLEDEARK